MRLLGGWQSAKPKRGFKSPIPDTPDPSSSSRMADSIRDCLDCLPGEYSHRELTIGLEVKKQAPGMTIGSTHMALVSVRPIRRHGMQNLVPFNAKRSIVTDVQGVGPRRSSNCAVAEDTNSTSHLPSRAMASGISGNIESRHPSSALA